LNDLDERDDHGFYLASRGGGWGGWYLYSHNLQYE
jgi:hypothetical protein